MLRFYMNNIFAVKIIEIFYLFWKQIEPEFRNKAFGADDKKRRNRAFKMSDSEIITILILLRLPNP